jgi:hypothetical protein
MVADGNIRRDRNVNLEIRLAAAVTVVALLPTLAAAEPVDACQYGTPAAFAAVAEGYVGDWRMNHLAGFVVTSAMTLPFGNDPDGPDTVTLFLQDGRLLLTHPEMPSPMVLDWADEPVWEFQREADADGVPEPLLTSGEIEMVMGCSNDRMARLIGRQTVVIEGVQMEFTYRFMVTGSTSMYGIMHTSAVAHGHPVEAWRSVSMVALD